MDLPAFNETGVWIAHIPGLPPDHLRYPELLDLLTVADPKDGTIVIKDEYDEAVIRAKDRMIRRGRWKLVYQPLETGYLLQLFDIATDPDCNQDVAIDYPELVSQLWDELRDWLLSDQVFGPTLRI